MNSEGRNKRGQFIKGNPHAAVANLKHGLYAFKLTGKVPSIRGARKLMHDLSRLRSELEAVTPGMNVKKSLLIDQVVSARGFMRLFEMYCKQQGILNPRLYPRGVTDFQPGFKTYLSFAAQQHKALLALGLNTEEAEKVLTPIEYIEQFDKAKAKKKAKK